MPTESSFGYVQCSSCNERMTDQFWVSSGNIFCSACYSKSSEPTTTKKKRTTCGNKECRTRLKYGSKLHPITKKEICHSCYSFVIMNGKDRETKREWKTLKEKMREYKNEKCANTFCQLPLLHTKRYTSHPITKEKICMSCYCYFRRNGKDREVIRVRGDYKNRMAQVFTQEEPWQENFLEMLKYMPTTVEVIKVNCTDQELDSAEDDNDSEQRPSDLDVFLDELLKPRWDLSQDFQPTADKSDIPVSDELRFEFLTNDHDGNRNFSQFDEHPIAEFIIDNAIEAESPPESSPRSEEPNSEEFVEERAVEPIKDTDGRLSPTPEIDEEDDVSDSDSSSDSSTSSESSESSEDSTDSESDYSMDSRLENVDNAAGPENAPEASTRLEKRNLEDFKEDHAVKPISCEIFESFEDPDDDLKISIPAIDEEDDTDSTSDSSTSSESSESSEGSTDSECDDSMDSTLEDNSTVTQYTEAPPPTFCSNPSFHSLLSPDSKPESFQGDITHAVGRMNATNKEDSLEVESPLQFELKQPTNKTQITHENPIQEPPKSKETDCYMIVRYEQFDERAPKRVIAKNTPSSKKCTKPPGKKKNIGISFKEKTCANIACQHQYSHGQELVADTLADRFNCYQPANYSSETNWNQEFVPIYEHQEIVQFNTSHTLQCYEPMQKDVSIIYSSKNSTETTTYTTLKSVSCIPSSEDPDIKTNCYKPPQEDVPIIYFSERSAGTELKPVSNIPSSENPVIQLVYEGHVPNCYKPSPQKHEWGDILSEYFPNDIENTKLQKNHPDVPTERPITDDPGQELNSDSSSQKPGNDPNSLSTESQELQNETILESPYEKERVINMFEGYKCAHNVCKEALNHQNIRTHPVTQEKICRRCYDYYKRVGRDREVIPTKRRKEIHETNCANVFCERTLFRGRINIHPVTKVKICTNCRAYYRRHGRDREVVDANMRKLLSDMLRKKDDGLIKCANTACQQLKLPGAEFLRHPATKEKVCRNCWQYYNKKGKDREMTTIRKKRGQHETNCANTFCNKLFYPRQLRPHPATKTMICSACYDYYKRHGRDREVVTTYRRNKRREEHGTHACYHYLKRTGRDREVVAGKVKKFKRDEYESESDTTSISSDDSSIEESSESDSESDSSEMDCE
ncbi:hypothetical protein CRE_23377 [Caenorhabditis remanei]|uniref:Uncharacterized protein n=1 Tax=Caenorhabditis remanei TaxID=31234 RepID=E3MH69_CAERE|nr:hypothetical protein CRE_23377 [Caenorhabditis remanei]